MSARKPVPVDSQSQVSNEVNTRQPRNYATSRAQRKWLERAHVHHPPLGRNSAQFGPLRGGCWVRPGLKRVREDLGGVKLLDAVEWQGTRQGRPWDATEQSLIDELDVRTLNATDLTKRRLDSRPIWLDAMVRDQFGDGAPVKAGFYRFVGDLLYARRVHAVGLRIAQTEAAAVYEVSDRQWRRWMATAEDVGIIRIIQTWEADRTKRSRHRRFGKLVYMLGPAIIERGGMALLEGLDIPLRDGRSCKRPAYHAGRKLRAERTQAIRATRDRLWLAKEARRERPAPSLNCLDMESPSPPPKGRGIGGPGKPGQGELATVEVCAARTAPTALPPNRPAAGASRMGPAPVAKSTPRPRKRGSVPAISSEDAATVYGEHSTAFAELWLKLGGAVHVLVFFAVSLLATACNVHSAGPRHAASADNVPSGPVPEPAYAAAPPKSGFYFFCLGHSTLGAVGATHGGYTKKSDGSHDSSRPARRWSGSPYFRVGWRYPGGRDPHAGPATGPFAGARVPSDGLPVQPGKGVRVGARTNTRYSEMMAHDMPHGCQCNAAGSRSWGSPGGVGETSCPARECQGSRSSPGRATGESIARSSPSHAASGSLCPSGNPEPANSPSVSGALRFAGLDFRGRRSVCQYGLVLLGSAGLRALAMGSDVTTTGASRCQSPYSLRGQILWPAQPRNVPARSMLRSPGYQLRCRLTLHSSGPPPPAPSPRRRTSCSNARLAATSAWMPPDSHSGPSK